jgi:carbonyl reductase 1
VINNAGTAMQGFDINIVRETLKTNYYGSLQATLDFLPLLRPQGRLVNVCSMSGKLNSYSDDIRARFVKAAETDVAAVSSIMEAFTHAVSEGREKEAGFPSAGYAVSKAGEIAMTKAVAMQEKKSGGQRLVNACCPGYVKTDMTRGGGVKTVDEGATTPVLLALGDIDGKTGGFWQNEKEVAW